MYLVHCTIDELVGITIRQIKIFTPACFSKFKPGINLQPLIVSLQGTARSEDHHGIKQQKI